jgi:hypothetical protein
MSETDKSHSWPTAGLIRGLSSLDDERGFKEKFLDGQMEQPVQSQEAQVQLGEYAF